MKNTIKLNEETITKLTILVTEIDREEAKEECDVDLVIENLYNIKDIIAQLLN